MAGPRLAALVAVDETPIDPANQEPSSRFRCIAWVHSVRTVIVLDGCLVARPARPEDEQRGLWDADRLMLSASS